MAPLPTDDPSAIAEGDTGSSTLISSIMAISAGGAATTL